MVLEITIDLLASGMHERGELFHGHRVVPVDVDDAYTLEVP